MSTQQVSAETAPRPYGNFVRPEKAGIGKFSRSESVLMLVGLGVFSLLVQANFFVGLGYLVVVGSLGYWGIKKDQYGISRMDDGVDKVKFTLGKKQGFNQYRSGPTGVIPSAKFQLPGLAAGAVPYACMDPLGRPFALIHHPDVDHYVLVLVADAEGDTLADQDQVDRWVANWGGFMKEAGHETDIVGGQVIVETARDFGGRMKAYVEAQISERASDYGRQVMIEAANPADSTSPMTRTWVTLTFSGSPHLGAPSRTLEDVAVAVASRVPSICEQIVHAGGAEATPVTETTIAKAVQVSYDPAIAEILDGMASRRERQSFELQNAGPAGHVSEWKYFRHDSGMSVCWSMPRPPRGEIYAKTLRELLKYDSHCDRKRVALLYRPVPVAEAETIAAQDVENASKKASSTKRVRHRTQQAHEAAVQSAKEEARGAGLVNFGIAATATVCDEASLADAQISVEGRGRASRVVLRPTFGAHDTTFAATLPLGLVLNSYVGLTTKFQEN